MKDRATVADDITLARDLARKQARRYHSDVKRLDRSRVELADAVKRCVSWGMTEQETADLVGVTRLTVRKWLGKDKR